jgi:phosphoglycerol transferase
MALSDDVLIQLIKEIGLRLDSLASGDEELSRLKMYRGQKSRSDFFEKKRTIDFRVPVVPEFVTSIHGFSGLEDFGRWTNADIARIVLEHPLPRKVKVSLTLRAHETNVKQPILVVVGGRAQVLKSVTYKLKTFQLKFRCRFESQMIELFIPNAISLNHESAGVNSDTRRIGLGVQLIELKA